MRTVEWKQRNGTMACHCIYSKEEADRLGIKYKPSWRDGLINDWVLTDDGFVVQILALHYDRANRKIMRTCTMTATSARTGVLDTRHRDSRYSLTGKLRDVPKKMTARLQAFCNLVCSGIPPEEAYVIAYKDTVKGERNSTNQWVKRRTGELMQLPMVKEEIRKGLGDKMDDIGMTVEWILRRYKSLIESGTNESAIVTALNKVSSFQGLDGSQKAGTNIPEIPNELLERLAGRTPVKGEVIDEGSSIGFVTSEPIDEAKIVTNNEAKEKNHEEVARTRRPSNAFDPDDYLGADA